MKTSKISRYFLVLLCALSYNIAWGQEAMRIYFNEYNGQENGMPTLSLAGNIPNGVSVSANGFIWATNYKESSFADRNCDDRVFAMKSPDKKSTNAVLTFTNFKNEIQRIEWNRMNDIFSNSILEIFRSLRVYGTTKSYTNDVLEGSEGSWMSLFGKRVSFGIENFPGTSDDFEFKGLSSLTLSERNATVITNSTREINDRCRFFIKAGTEEQEKNRKATIFDWNPDHHYAFQIFYYNPSVSFKKTMPSQIKLGQKVDVSQLYTIDHPGAFNFTTTYESSNTQIFTVDKNGVITPKNLGRANITVTITDGDMNKSVLKEIEVINPTLASNQYDVILMYNDKTQDGETVIATLNKDMPTVTPPTRTGYNFRGYFDGKDYSQTEDWANKYYNADGTSAKKWDKNYNSTLYGHWTAKTYTINFDACGGKLSDKVGIRTGEGQDRYIETSNDQSFVSFDVQYGSEIADRFWCSDKITIKPGYKFLGWFTEKTGGTKVYSVDDNECSFNAIEGDYWTGNSTSGDWKYEAPKGTLNLYAQYECKFEIVDNGERINFKEGYDISSLDINAAIDECQTKYGVAPLIVDITKYPKYIQPGPGMVNSKGDKIDDGAEAFNTVVEEARLDNKLAPNAIVYLSKESSLYTGATNVVMMKEDKCLNLEVTDRAPIKIPYAFKANKALYERNKNYNDKDAAKAQAANSVWGTLCLPYPIRNNANNVKFYELANFENNIMHYTPMNVDVIPANTPVLYKRLNGVGSDVKIEEADVDVPVNTSYSTNSGSSLTSWQFIGTLTTKIFCGKDYDNKKVPEGAEKMDGSKEIYYFKQDQFTHLSNTGKVTMLPYRAYFTTTVANAKFASFSIIAVDEEGATDITNLIDSDAEGDGKIYDLNGRRVMQPVSGRLYIVNGKKKVY